MNNMKNEKNVLIALSGMSPAVLTEAVWGLAMSKPAVVPDEIVVLTTAKGRTLIQEQLLKGGIWDKLKVALSKRGVDIDGKLVFNEEMPVFTHRGKALEDLSTREQNLAAANTMMRVIHQYAEGDEYVIHALMAGGRKTMSALFFSSMCLLGRKSDHIYHVLVSDGYEDSRLKPLFFFPQKGIVHKMTKTVTHGKKNVVTDVALNSEACEINLFDVPFVPMGEWAEQKCRAVSKGLNYENIINAVANSMDAALFPAVTVDLSGDGMIMLDNRELDVSPTNFMVLLLLLQGSGSDGVKSRIDQMKDVMAGQEDVWNDYEMMLERANIRWVGKFFWKVQRIGKSETKVLREAFYQDGKQDADYNRAKSTVKSALAGMSAERLLDLFEPRADGALADVFDYRAVEWRNVDKVPKALRTLIFPLNVPFPVKI